jgi:hypothetical protein
VRFKLLNLYDRFAAVFLRGFQFNLHFGRELFQYLSQFVTRVFLHVYKLLPLFGLPYKKYTYLHIDIHCAIKTRCQWKLLRIRFPSESGLCIKEAPKLLIILISEQDITALYQRVYSYFYYLFKLYYKKLNLQFANNLLDSRYEKKFIVMYI